MSTLCACNTQTWVDDILWVCWQSTLMSVSLILTFANLSLSRSVLKRNSDCKPIQAMNRYLSYVSKKLRAIQQDIPLSYHRSDHHFTPQPIGVTTDQTNKPRSDRYNLGKKVHFDTRLDVEYPSPGTP